MNKKQELVNQVITNLEQAHVDFSGYESLRAPEDFWEEYPQGHCNDTMVSVCLEYLLSCLTNKSLESIVKLGPPCDGVSVSNWWRELGQLGHLKDDPMIMEVEGVPVLRIRHDSYLSWFRGYCFQNSYDAYGHGSNGESPHTLEEAVSLCKTFYHPDARDLCDSLLRSELDACCKALVLYYPFYACRGKSTFYKAINKFPEVFNDLIQETDDKLMHIGLSSKMSMASLCETMTSSDMGCLPWVHLPVIYKDMQIALLCLGATSVQLAWSVQRERHVFTLNFPTWGYEISAQESLYRETMWEALAVTMLTLAGFTFQGNCIAPFDLTTVDPIEPYLYPKEDYIDTLESLHTRLRKAAQ